MQYAALVVFFAEENLEPELGGVLTFCEAAIAVNGKVDWCRVRRGLQNSTIRVFVSLPDDFADCFYDRRTKTIFCNLRCLMRMQCLVQCAGATEVFDEEACILWRFQPLAKVSMCWGVVIGRGGFSLVLLILVCRRRWICSCRVDRFRTFVLSCSLWQGIYLYQHESSP